MSKRHENITSEMLDWIREQKMFFVATAPRALDGHINVSPKVGDSFRVLGPLEAVYQDFTGSGAETAAHVRENGRIVIMFCAFQGPPKIVRIHGYATLITTEDPRYAEFVELFPVNPGTRAFVHIRVDRVSDSCGYSVPLYQFQGQRETLDRWAAAKTSEGLNAYRAMKNRESIDGLPALVPKRNARRGSQNPETTQSQDWGAAVQPRYLFLPTATPFYGETSSRCLKRASIRITVLLMPR